MPTFKKRDWQNIRPDQAKGSGVGKAIENMAKAERKTSSIRDCTTALLASAKLKEALRKGEAKAKNVGTREEQSTFRTTLTRWRNELKNIETSIKDQRKRHCIYELLVLGDNLTTPLAEQCLQLRVKIRDVSRVQAATEDPTERSAKIHGKVDKVYQNLVTKADPKATAAGLKRHLVKLAAGFIKRGMMAASDIPNDTDRRSDLAAQLGELKKEYATFSALFEDAT